MMLVLMAHLNEASLSKLCLYGPDVLYRVYVMLLFYCSPQIFLRLLSLFDHTSVWYIQETHKVNIGLEH